MPVDAGIPVDGARLYRRSVGIGLVVGVPLSLVFLWLALSGLQPGQVWGALRGANPLDVALAVVLMGVIYSIQALRWRWISRRSAELPWRTYLRLIVCSVAVNNVIPGRPGEVLRGYWLGRAGRLPQARAFSTVLVDRSSDVLLLVVAFAATFPFVPHPSWLRHVFVAAIVFGALLAGGLALARLHVGGLRLPVIRHTPSSWLRQQVGGFVHGAGALVNRRDVAVITVLTAASWACWALAAELVASALGIALSPLAVIFLTTVINLAAAIPSSPGFVGTFQWICVSGMALFGVGRAEAVAFSILMQASWYIPTTAAGLALMGHSGLTRWLSPSMADARPPV
jgi:hypothetical protein